MEKDVYRRVANFYRKCFVWEKISVNGLGDEKLDFTYILDLIQEFQNQ